MTANKISNCLYYSVTWTEPTGGTGSIPCVNPIEVSRMIRSFDERGTFYTFKPLRFTPCTATNR